MATTLFCCKSSNQITKIPDEIWIFLFGEFAYSLNNKGSLCLEDQISDGQRVWWEATYSSLRIAKFGGWYSFIKRRQGGMDQEKKLVSSSKNHTWFF